MTRRFQFNLRRLLFAVLLIGTGCGLLRMVLDEEDTIEVTNNPLDLAIHGDGFFAVSDPATPGLLYTRAGNLAVNSNGQLVIGSANSGRIVQPQLSLAVGTSMMVTTGNGEVWAPNSPRFSKVGSLRLSKFVNPRGLLKVGQNLYQETASSGPPTVGQPGEEGFGSIFQNCLERRFIKR